jgi:hypothetical protein
MYKKLALEFFTKKIKIKYRWQGIEKKPLKKQKISLLKRTKNAQKTQLSCQW